MRRMRPSVSAGLGSITQEAVAMSGTRKVAIALLGLIFLAMWLAIVSNAQPTVPIPY